MHENEPVEFSVVKKSAIAQYSLKERLVLQRVRSLILISYRILINNARKSTTKGCSMHVVPAESF